MTRQSFHNIPNWFSWENQGVGIAATSLVQGRNDLVVFMVDAPLGRNRGLYRTGKGVDREGNVTAGWTAWREVPGWPTVFNAGANIAAADVTGSGRPDLVVLQVDASGAENRGLFRIGKDLDAEGVVQGGWTQWSEVPEWNSESNQGCAIALSDLDASGHLDIVIFMIDSPMGENQARFRVGRNLDDGGAVGGGWTPWQTVPNWFSWENQGAGVAVIDRAGGTKDLVVFHVDNPPGQNQAFYRFGKDLRADGLLHTDVEPWTPWFGVPDWFSWSNHGAGLCVAHLDGQESNQLVFITADSPPGPNAGLYQVLSLDADPAARGTWELLKYDSEVLAVHAALLPNGKVLFFAGSGNSEVRFKDRAFGDTSVGNWCSVVWDPTAARPDGTDANFFHPDTLRGPDGKPLDFFCGGATLLPDGRILSAGGTSEYEVKGFGGHNFYGRRDAQVFDPATEQWSQVASMARGRWYPTLITLGDGRILTSSGLDDDGHVNATLELYTPNAAGGEWKSLQFPHLAGFLALPLYAHLFELIDGRVLFTGGHMDDANAKESCLISLSEDPVDVTHIEGLQLPFSRSQSASVMLGPAQDQRFMVMGGALPIGEFNANDNVDVIDFSDPSGDLPRFRPAAPMLLPRIHLNAVLLPDRTVFVTGGALQREGGPQGERRTVARLESEIYDPEHDRWTLTANASIVRMYHSIALLLPDGRVVTASGNPDMGSHVEWGDDDNEELHLEIYSPPYMVRSRPTISDAPQDWQYGQKVTVRTPNAADILWASLIRPGVTTHSFNTSQRLVDLPILSRKAGQLQLETPLARNLAPPGWYMLFLTDNARTPSEARWVKLT